MHNHPATSSAPSHCEARARAGGRRCVAPWAAIVMAVLVVPLAALRAAGAPQEPAAAGTLSIAVVIDYNDGCQRVYPRIPWAAGMTAWDALAAIQRLPHGVAVEKSGSTSRDAFIRRIDDLANEGGGKGKRNWLYWIDGVMAKQGVGTQPINAGQTLLFKFAVWESTSQS